MIEKDTCPVCGAQFKYTESIQGDTEIKAGDLAACASCASYLVYEEDGTYRLVTVDEIVELDNDILYELTVARNCILRREKNAIRRPSWNEFLNDLFSSSNDE